MSYDKLRVAVVGAGWAGTQRAATIEGHPRTEVAMVVDTDLEAARRLGEHHQAPFVTDYKEALSDTTIEVVVVATPNAFLAEIAIAALQAGRHVLVEQPMGRTVAEAVAIAGAASEAERILKIGFNHRYHPALTRAYAYYAEGVIGDIINIRARYGHGDRPNQAGDWRENREFAGGGQLTDHGLHVLDLVHWFAGEPKEVFSFLQTAVWPIKPLEDSAFALMRFESGVVASMHTAWTQWEEMFSFEIFGTQGSLTIEGLGERYGQHRLSVARRRTGGGHPYTETTFFDDEDISWAAEWDELVGAIDDGRAYLGSPHDGVTVMNMLDALYRSAESGQLVSL